MSDAPDDLQIGDEIDSPDFGRRTLLQLTGLAAALAAGLTAGPTTAATPALHPTRDPKSKLENSSMTAQSATPIAPPYGAQLTLIAFVRAKPGMGDELGRRLLTLVEPARAEPGNINYDLHRSNENPDEWVLYENWKAPSDLTAHFELPYMKAFVAALPEVLAGEMDLRRCAMVSTVAARA